MAEPLLPPSRLHTPTAELNPQAEIPALVITTIYPGANPPEVEAQITKPLEDVVGTVPGGGIHHYDYLKCSRYL